MKNPFAGRSIMDMSELATDIGVVVSSLVDKHENLGAVLVLYDLSVDEGAVSFAATEYERAPRALKHAVRIMEGN